MPSTGLEPPPLHRLCLDAPRTEAVSWPGVVPSQPPPSLGAGSQARPSPACSLSWGPLPTQGSLKAEGCRGRRAASQPRAGTLASGSVLATADGTQWGQLVKRASLPQPGGTLSREEVASCCGLAAACVCLALPLEGGPEGEGSGASRAGAQ